MNALKDSIAARLSVRGKLLGTSLVLLAMMSVIGILSIVNLASVNDKAHESYAQATVAIEHLSKANSALIDKARLVTYAVVVGQNAEAQAKIDTQIAADDKTIAEKIAAYEKLDLTVDELATLATFKEAERRYQSGVDDILTPSKSGDIAGRECRNHARGRDPRRDDGRDKRSSSRWPTTRLRR